MASENLAKYPFDEKYGKKYLKDVCPMKGWSDKKAILSFISRHNLTALHAKFYICQTPCSCFLQITSQIFEKLCETKYPF